MRGRHVLRVTFEGQPLQSSSPTPPHALCQAIATDGQRLPHRRRGEKGHTLSCPNIEMEAHPLRRYSKRVNIASGMRLPARDRGKRGQSDSGVWQFNCRALGAAAMTAGRSAMRLDRTPRGTWQRRLHGQTARDSRAQAGPSTRSSSGARGWWRPPSILPVTFRINA